MFIAAEPHSTGTRSPWAIRALRPCQDLVVAQGLFLKVLFHQRVFALGRGFDENHARLFDRIGHVVRDRALGRFLAQVGLLGQQIHDPLKIGLAADGQLDGTAATSNLAEIWATTLPKSTFSRSILFTKTSRGRFLFAGIVPHLLGTHLHTAHRVENDHSAVGHVNGTDHLADKIHVAGRVQHVQLVALPLAGDQRRVDGHLAAAFLFVPVGNRRAIVHAAQAVDRAAYRTASHRPARSCPIRRGPTGQHCATCHSCRSSSNSSVKSHRYPQRLSGV